MLVSSHNPSPKLDIIMVMLNVLCMAGALVGTYATSNGAPEPGSGNKAFVSRWRYYGQGQEVDYGVLV